ncbi:hypothetical protein L6R52_22250 [Myxococcota bacterium]|nr:hypothetical protein [Myxococcota bacterium]
MSIHQLNLRAPEKKARAIDEKVIAKYLRGEASLLDALKVDEKSTSALRRQAHALYEAGKWQQCIDVLLGLAAIGDVDAFDPLLLAGAYTELGDADAAEKCMKAGERMLQKLSDLLGTIESGKAE